MCGIAGLLDLDARSTPTELHEQAARMADVIRHRGPDDHGTWADPSAGVAFGHQRLAIIDLSDAGHQPMTSSDRRWTVTFNGELYNFPELRRDLEAGGVRFRGHADTEVLVEALAHWGLDETIRRANAMLAMAAWDASSRELHLVRDRLGEKPLYWSRRGRSFLFASELEALRRHPAFDDEIDRDALALYFARSFVPAPKTIYRGAHKLEPGTVLTISQLQPEPRIRSYWSLAEVMAGPIDRVGDDEAIGELDELLDDAVRMRRQADVPIGAFLSGGIDSSAVVALLAAGGASPVRTFTIGFGDRAMDETDQARAVASYLGTDHHEIELSPDLAISSVGRLGRVYDEPFGDPSSLPTLLVCEAARSTLTVALSGDGGDEVFAGYNRHVLGERLWRRAARTPRPLRVAAAAAVGAVPHSWMRSAGRPLERALRNPADKLERLARILPARTEDDLARRLLTTWAGVDLVIGGDGEVQLPPQPRAGGIAERLAYVDTLTTLPDDMLVKVDRASMHVALEVRVPLLDHRVVEWVWRRPFDLRLRDGVGKWALREVLARHVPRSLTDRPKMGFDPPMRAWLRGPLRPWAEDLLSTGRLQDEGLLRPEPIARAWREHQAGRKNHEYQLWSVLAFQSWIDAHRS